MLKEMTLLWEYSFFQANSVQLLSLLERHCTESCTRRRSGMSKAHHWVRLLPVGRLSEGGHGCGGEWEVRFSQLISDRNLWFGH